MILPTKHITPQNSLLGISAVILSKITAPQTVTSLWEKTRKIPEIASFERFSLALSFLFTVGLIEFDNYKIRKVN